MGLRAHAHVAVQQEMYTTYNTHVHVYTDCTVICTTCTVHVTHSGNYIIKLIVQQMQVGSSSTCTCYNYKSKI